MLAEGPEPDRAIRLGVGLGQLADLYRRCGFEPFGLERRALKLGDRYIDEEHLMLFLEARSSPA